MNQNNIGKEFLSRGYTCVLQKGNSIITSTKTGISPIMGFIDEKLDLNGYYLYDKIVGKAVAMLVLYTKIKFVYGEVMSESAIEIFEKNHISYEYKEKTDKIINREKTGLCPMETAILTIDDEKKAYNILKEKLIEMKSKSNL